MGRLIDLWLRWLKRRGSWKMVSRSPGGGRPAEPYLERYYLLRVGGCALFLHRFWSSDPDDPHDHPWNWASLILRGGYLEVGIGEDDWRVCEAGDFRWRQAQVFHRVILRDEDRGAVWSLFWHGRRRRKWGFIDDGRWTSAESTGDQDPRPMRGWIFPRFLDTKTED